MRIGVMDIGGSHASAGVAMPGSPPSVDAVVRRPMDPHGDRRHLLSTIEGVARSVDDASIDAWGVATPGPFDYERGIALLEGVDKLDALYGVDLRTFLAGSLTVVDSSRIRFLNDADAFALGEWAAGAGAGYDRVVGLTIGTGLGSGFVADGRIVEEGPGVPPDASIGLVPLDGDVIEDRYSGRGITRLHRDETGEDLAAEMLAAAARAGSAVAVRTWERFGSGLAEAIAPYLDEFGAECVVLGGSVARAWELFGRTLTAGLDGLRELREVAPAAHLERAALFGAARRVELALADGAEDGSV